MKERHNIVSLVKELAPSEVEGENPEGFCSNLTNSDNSNIVISKYSSIGVFRVEDYAYGKVQRSLAGTKPGRKKTGRKGAKKFIGKHTISGIKSKENAGDK